MYFAVLISATSVHAVPFQDSTTSVTWFGFTTPPAAIAAVEVPVPPGLSLPVFKSAAEDHDPVSIKDAAGSLVTV